MLALCNKGKKIIIIVTVIILIIHHTLSDDTYFKLKSVPASSMSSDSFSPVESNFGVFAKKYSISLFMEFIKKVIITHDFNISYR